MSVYPSALPTVRPAVRSAFEQGSGGGAASIIAGLFAQGQQGFWLPFTNFASLTQDSAGTLPYTALEQPVGRVLDRSGRGNHATQVTSTARGVVSARVNLLQATDQLSNVAWAKTASGTGSVPIVTDNYGLAPDGTMTAARVQMDLNGGAGSTANFSQIANTGATTAGQGYTQTIWIKSLLGSRTLNWRDDAGSLVSRNLTLDDNTWQVFTAVGTSSSASSALAMRFRGGFDPSDKGDFLFWHPSMTTTAQAALPYQRVTTPTDYDAVGFPKYLTFDGVDDRLQATLPAITGTWIVGYKEGTLVYKANIPAGAFPIGTNTNGVFYTPSKNFVGMVLRAGDLTEVEVSVVERYLVANGAGAAGVDAFAGVSNFGGAWLGCSSLTSFPLINTAAGTNFSSAWYLCSSLTSFPLINTANGTNFYAAWYGCTSLTSFPLINTAAGTNFYVAWYLCSSLTSFPANMFDSCPATNFTSAFQNCALSQASVDGILASLVTAGKSNGTLNMHGGTSSTPSAAGLASKATLVSRGWTVTHN